MLANIIKQTIIFGNIDGLENKVDGFYAVGKLTKKEYDEIIELLKNKIK